MAENRWETTKAFNVLQILTNTCVLLWTCTLKEKKKKMHGVLISVRCWNRLDVMYQYEQIIYTVLLDSIDNYEVFIKFYTCIPAAIH